MVKALELRGVSLVVQPTSGAGPLPAPLPPLLRSPRLQVLPRAERNRSTINFKLTLP